MTNSAPYRLAPREEAPAKKPSLAVIAGQAGGARNVVWPLLVIILLAAAMTIGLPLVLNTHMAQRAYDIRDMKIQLAELKTETAGLETDIMVVSSPEVLASKAEAIGLVPAATVGIISLEQGIVEGGEPAQ